MTRVAFRWAKNHAKNRVEFAVIALFSLIRLLVGLLIVRVTVSVVSNYVDYLPPDFDAEFLVGREGYFFGDYQWAFYPHIIAGPCSLIFGLLLVSDRFRSKSPAWHRKLGRIQTLLVLGLIAPSGLWMAFYTEGTVASVGFGLLAILTGISITLGWRTAVKRQFADHRRWMWRCYLLLCSAVVVRVIGGIASLAELDTAWTYPFAAWVSWLVPLFVFEFVTRLPHTVAEPTGQETTS